MAEPHERTSFSGADFLAGGTVPVELHLQVKLRPDDQADHLHIDPDLESHLRKSNAAILEWVGRGPTNGVQILTDPIAALAAAGVKLSLSERERLAHELERRADRDVFPAGVRLVSVSVENDRTQTGRRDVVDKKTAKRGGRHGKG